MNKEDLIILASLGFFLRDINENDEIFDSMFNEKQTKKFIELANQLDENGKEVKETLMNLVKEYILKLNNCDLGGKK